MFKTIFWASALYAAAVFPALADQWSKSFSVGAAPELRIETSEIGRASCRERVLRLV